MLVCVYAYELQVFLVFLAPRVFVCNVFADGIEAG